VAQSLVLEIERGDRFPSKGADVALTKIREVKGQGVTAFDSNGDQYRLGSRPFAAPFLPNEIAHLYLSKNEELLAAIDIEDDVKQEAAAMIGYLHREGKNPVILSGDRKEKVEEVAGQLGVKEFYPRKLPDEKLHLIAKLSAKTPTAMIGDGINDAPALAKATIGVSLSNASQVAVQSAQIVLLDGKLDRLSKAHAISKATLLTIKQNLFWAFAYNIVAIPVAALGFLNPTWGAIFMAFSDVVVIGNSIRLKTKKIRHG
jgi:Cu+-exporting ATPase